MTLPAEPHRSVVAAARRAAALWVPWLTAGAAAALVLWLSRAALTAATADLMGVEQNSVFALARLAATGRIYTPPGDLPFVVFQYAPLYTYASRGVLTLLGADGVADLYLASRATSAVAVVLTAVGVAATLRRHGAVAGPWAVIAGLVAAAGVFPSAYVARPDGMCLALLVWSWFLFLGFLARPRPAPLVLALLLWGAAGLTKQTALVFAAPAAAGALVMLWRTRRSHAVLVAVAAATMAAAALAFLPPAFIANTRVGVANGISYRVAVSATYAPLFAGHAMLLGAWAVASMAALTRAAPAARATLVAGAYCFCMATVMAGKIGSNTNYYNEFVILAVMLVTMEFAALRRPFGFGRLRRTVAASLLSLAFCTTLVQANALPVLRRGGQTIAGLEGLRTLGAAEATEGLVLDLHGGTGVAFPSRTAAAPFDVVGFSHAAGHLPLDPVVAAVRAGLICHAAIRTDLLAAVALRQSARYPVWGGGILESLVELFEPGPTEGGHMLMRNPRCRP